MSEYIMYNLTNYLMLTLVFFIIILAGSILIYLNTKKINIHKKGTRYFGLISALKSKQIAMLCSILIRTILIVYAVIIYQTNVITTIIMIIFADIIFIILKRSIFEIFNITAQVFLIYFINILQEYRIHVSDENYVFLIQIALTVFLITYVLYFLLKNFVETLTDRKIQEKKLEDKQKNKK